MYFDQAIVKGSGIPARTLFINTKPPWYYHQLDHVIAWSKIGFLFKADTASQREKTLNCIDQMLSMKVQ